MKHLVFFCLFLLSLNRLHAQVIFSSDFSSIADWNVVYPAHSNYPTYLSFDEERCNFYEISGYETYPNARVYHPLDDELEYPFRLKTELTIFDYSPVWGGSILPIVATSGVLDPLWDCPDYATCFDIIPGSGDYSNQNAIGIMVYTPYGFESPFYCKPLIKLGQTFLEPVYSPSSDHLQILPHENYEIVLEMFNRQSGAVQVRDLNSQEARHLCFDLPESIPDLNTIQVAGNAIADPKRYLYGYVDNIVVSHSEHPDCYAISAAGEARAAPVSIFPNPNTGLFTVTLSQGIRFIQIYDIYGKLILTQKTDGQETVSFDLSKQPNGVYLLRTDRGEVMRVVKGA